MKRGILLSGLAILLLASCKDDNDQNDLNSTDKSFIMNASLANQAEISAGQLAATKGTNTSVRAYGQMMVTEHTPALTELQSIATSVGVQVPTTLDTAHQSLMTLLNSLTGRAFDSVYIRSQVNDHQNTLNIFTQEINSGNHQQVRAYASKYQPHIQAHLVTADSIRTHL